MLDAALAGVALAQVPEPIAHEHALAGRLREGLAKCAATTLGVFLYCSDRKQVSSKLRAFIDHARDFSTSRGDGKKKDRLHQRRKLLRRPSSGQNQPLRASA